MSERIELPPCARCGESGFIVSWDGKHMGRPHRITKCKKYGKSRNGMAERICSTAICSTLEEAIAEWKSQIAITADASGAVAGGSEKE